MIGIMQYYLNLPQLLMAPLFALCCALVWQFIARQTRKFKGLPLPPGPKRVIPWVGNALEMPVVAQWTVFEDWRKKYGGCLQSRLAECI